MKTKTREDPELPKVIYLLCFFMKNNEKRGGRMLSFPGLFPL